MKSPRDAGHIRGLTLAVRAAQVMSSYHTESRPAYHNAERLFRGEGWSDDMMNPPQLNMNSTTFREAFRGYLLAQQARKVVPRYLDMLERTRDYFTKRMGDLLLSEITPEHIRRFIVWLQGEDDTAGAPPPPRSHKSGGNVSGAYVDIHFRNLRAFFRWSEDEELLVRSPMRKVKKPIYERTIPEALTEAEAADLLESVKTNRDRNAFRDYVIHMFMIYTGVRLAELVQLDVGDLDLETGYAKIRKGKGRKPRIVPMEIELRREVSRYQLRHRRAAPGEVALFVNEYGFRLEKRGVQSLVIRDLKRYISRPLVKRGPHTLRHTFTTLLMRATGNLKMVSMILGHTTTRVTEGYTHLVGVDVLRSVETSPITNQLRSRNGRGASTVTELEA